jgi:hypothetical protein
VIGKREVEVIASFDVGKDQSRRLILFESRQLRALGHDHVVVSSSCDQDLRILQILVEVEHVVGHKDLKRPDPEDEEGAFVASLAVDGSEIDESSIVRQGHLEGVMEGVMLERVIYSSIVGEGSDRG